jgi:UDP-N-acetyl-2-amino-2-deoxyglucuronate dehydrogenase
MSERASQGAFFSDRGAERGADERLREEGMSRGRVRFAVIGAGMIGRVHAAALADLPDTAELAVITDIDAAKARAVAEQYGATESTTDVASILARDDIDAVIICTPSGLHADLAVAALNAGKHVVIEKPIEITLAAADRIISAESRSRKKVTVISQHRFDRSTEKVMKAMADGAYGTITSAIASHAWWRGQTYYDSGDWRGTWALDGGGAVLNQTVHTINLMIAIVGAPIEVFAYTACLAHERIEVEDTAVAVVKFATGGLGIIHGTTAAYPGLDARLSVYGTKGSAVISDDQLVYLYETVGDAQEIAMSDKTGQNQVTEEFRLGTDDVGLGSAHRAQLADFITAITTDGTPRVSTADARTSLAVILAMYESARTGQPVRL